MEKQLTTFEKVTFQGTPALFTSLRLGRGEVPEGMFRYEIREESGEPCQLAKGILINHFGTLLTTDPIQLPADGYLCFDAEDLYFDGGRCITAEEFCERYPSTGRTVLEIYEGRPGESALFFSNGEENEKMLGCIAHMRGDFEGNEILHTTWWPHYWDAECNDERFRDDLAHVENWLRAEFAPLHSLKAMRGFCNLRKESQIPGESVECYGFRIESGKYLYMLRCTPLKGWYHMYLYCYRKDMAAGKGVMTAETFSYETAKVGDLVEEAVVDNAINCLPPACMRGDCTQMGEPCSHKEDPDTGKWRPTYATFKRIGGTTWQYCGRCFCGENVERGCDPANMATESEAT